MQKILSVILSVALAAFFPAAVSAAETTYESEQGQATIGPPSGSTSSAQSDTGESSGEETEDFSSGVDWGAANTASSPASSSSQKEFTVMIDPGHQGPSIDMSAQEPMAPNSSETKPKATTGTTGNYSGVGEYQVNLDVSLLLRDELKARGYQVLMTREDNETAISNKERAELAASSGADITVRIHANSDTDSSVSGALAMAPTASNQYLDQETIERSNTLASCILDHYCTATGLTNKGVLSADSLTGTNWSTVPVALLEMGFMSNQNDDLYITDSSHYKTMVQGIADGIDEYFSIVEPQQESVLDGIHLSALTDTLQNSYINALAAAGEKWAVAAMDLNTRAYSTINADQALQSASVIKVFIMGTVYENLVYAAGNGQVSDSYEGTLKPLLTSMITVSDNDAANQLVSLCGNGDFNTGLAAVNEFCQKHGYTSTHLGRAFLAENPTDDNYTSASDCCRILAEIYSGTLVNETASADMLSLLKQQTRKTKIPAGVPSGVETANKTGEMTSGYNLGVIENDMAIVFDSNHPYILVVLSNDISDNSSAQSTIQQISSTVYTYMTTELDAALAAAEPTPTPTPAAS